nr:phosphatase PAP2 family protein [uncultured Sellimonas sp.]
MNVLWFLEGIRTTAGNVLFQFVTCFGQETFLLAVLCCLYWCVDKSFACQIGLTYFSSGLVVQGLKVTFRIPRPWILDPDFPPVPGALSHATGYSFPSGHTQGGTCLFAPLAIKAKQRALKILFSAAFLLIGFSRMYLGVHTPKDVLAALIISLCFSWFFARYGSLLLSHVRTLSLVLAFCALAVLLYTGLLLRLGCLDIRYAGDCIKASGAGVGFAVGLYLEQTRLRFSTVTRTPYGQAWKLLAGLVSTLILRQLLTLPASGLFWDAFVSGILVLWILFFYPAVFTALSKKR